MDFIGPLPEDSGYSTAKVETISIRIEVTGNEAGHVRFTGQNLLF